MQIHITPVIPVGELPVAMNPGIGDPFGVIDFGCADLIIQSDEDADRLIRAASRIKAMRAMGSTPHAWQRMEGTSNRCDVCGLLKKDGPHDDAEVQP